MSSSFSVSFRKYPKSCLNFHVYNKAYIVGPLFWSSTWRAEPFTLKRPGDVLASRTTPRKKIPPFWPEKPIQTETVGQGIIQEFVLCSDMKRLRPVGNFRYSHKRFGLLSFSDARCSNLKYGRSLIHLHSLIAFSLLPINRRQPLYLTPTEVGAQPSRYQLPATTQKKLPRSDKTPIAGLVIPAKTPTPDPKFAAKPRNHFVIRHFSVRHSAVQPLFKEPYNLPKRLIGHLAMNTVKRDFRCPQQPPQSHHQLQT